MATTIGIMGDTGTGKTTSVRTLDPSSTYYINADGKSLSFKGWRKLYNAESRNYKVTADPKEIHRTLKPGGKIRIVVPDILVGIKSYLKGNTIKGPYFDRRYPPTNLCKLLSWINSKGKYGRLEHRMAFDWNTLLYFLKQAGFTQIERRSFNDCSPVFQGKDFKKYSKWSLYAEVTNNFK